MITRNQLRAIALASTCLAPSLAFAQAPMPAPAPAAPTVIGGVPFIGEIGVGLLGVMGTNPNLYGRYRGTNTTGVDFVGDFEFLGRSPWDSGGTRYYEIIGDNLVFQTGNHLGYGLNSDSAWASSVSNHLANEGTISFRAGDQGTWGIGAHYEAITYTGNVIDSLYTVTGNVGVLNNNLAPFGGATPGVRGPVTAFTIPTLTATGAMQPFQVGTRRDTIGADFKYLWGDWTFTGAFSHMHKEGRLESSFDGPFAGAAFTLPVDFDTDRYDVTAAYTTRLYQASVQYTFSHFTDNNLFVTLPYPTSGTASPFQRATAYSTPPSNEAHYVTLLLATNAIPLTRINLNARVGVEKQDNTFPPNTADPRGPNLIGANLVGLNGALQGTSAGSPDILATIYQMRISATTTPFRNFDARAYYGIDGRSVSLNQFRVTTGGTGGLGSDTTPGGAANANFVVPQEWLKQNVGGEVGYRLIPEYDTKLTAGYRLDRVDRSNAQVAHSATSTGTVALSSMIGPQIDGKISFDYVNRTGKLSYLTPWANFDGPGAAQVFSGAYYQAPMTSEGVTVRADYTPSNTLAGGFFLQFKNENYRYAAIPLIAGSTLTNIPLTGVGGGLKQDYALALGPDITYRPAPNLDIHFFYTFERLFFNFQGNGACSTIESIAAVAGTTSACTGSVGFNLNKSTSDTHTIGLSGEWRVNEKLKLKGDYTVAVGSVMYTQFNGVFVPFTPVQSYQNVSNYPDINTMVHSLRLTATYDVSPSIQLVGQAAYSYFRNNDWNDTANSIQGAGTTSISILTPGYAAPYYSVVALLGAVKFRF